MARVKTGGIGGGGEARRPMHPEMIAAVTEGLPGMAERGNVAVEHNTLSSLSQIVRGGLQETVCWLHFCGLTGREIARRLNLGKDSVAKYLKTPEFRQHYEANRLQMIARVNEHTRERFQEVMIRAVEGKIALMESTHDDRLRDKIYDDFIKYGQEAMKGGSTGISSTLEKIYEQMRTTRAPDGTRITTKIRLVGRTAADAARSGENTPLDGGPSPPSGENGPGEAPVQAGEAGDHGGEPGN